MTNTKESKQLLDKLLKDIKDERESPEPMSLEEVLADMDSDIYKNTIMCQVLLFLCSNLWKKLYGTSLTSKQLREIQEAILKSEKS